MTAEMLFCKIDSAWDNSIQKAVKKIEHLFDIQICSNDTHIYDFSPETNQKITKLFSSPTSNIFSINLLNEPKEFYNALKIAILSDWLYHNIPEYAVKESSLTELCSNAHCYQKDEKRIYKKILKSSKNLCEPNNNISDWWLSSYSELSKITEDSSFSSIYSYNITYQLICNWNQLLKFVQNDDDLEPLEVMQSLLITIAADSQEISGSKTGLGCIAPNYIIQQFLEENLSPYFFLDLFHRLVTLKKDIEKNIAKEILDSYESSIKNTVNQLVKNKSPYLQSLQPPSSFEHKNSLNSYIYKYDFLQITYFAFLCNAVYIGKCRSHIMKNYYLNCLEKQFIQQTNYYFSHNENSPNYSTMTLPFFNKQLELCNAFYRCVYNLFSNGMRTMLGEVKAMVNENSSVFDIYFTDSSNYFASLYSKNKRLSQREYYTNDIKALLSDLLIVKAQNYTCLPSWKKYYENYNVNQQIIKLLSNDFTLNPVAQHFNPLEKIFNSSDQKKINSLLSRQNEFNSIPHIISSDTNTSNLKVSIKK